MAFCGKCGTQVEDGIKFCPTCGTPIDAPQQANQTAQQTQQTTQQQTGAQTDFSAKVAGLNNTADTTADFDPQDIESNKTMGVLAYLSWLVIIPLLAAPTSKFSRFHANQGLVLAITEIAWWIIEVILSIILYSISWRLGFISTILGFVNIGFVILAVLGIVNALNGKAKELPIIGKFKILK